MNETRLNKVETSLRDLTIRLNTFHPTAEGFVIGSTRLLEKLVTDEYHLLQRDSEGVETDLAAWGSLKVIAGTGLNIIVRAGRARIDQAIYNFPTHTHFALLAASTYRVYVSVAGVITAAVVGAYPANAIPLAVVVTGATTLTSITDERCFHYEDTAAGMAAPHNILDGGVSHLDSTLDAVSIGSMIIGNATPAWDELVIAVPAANVRNVLGIDNAETVPSWKTALDATHPVAVAAGAAGTEGTSLVFSHRDHEHAAPATWPATAHNLLSATHGDAAVGAAVLGDVIVGLAGPLWTRYAISVPGANLRNVLGVDAGDTVPTYKALLDGNNPADIAAAASAGTSLFAAHRDHVHAHPDLGDLHTGYLTPAEHTLIGDAAPHHARLHSLGDAADHSHLTDYTVSLGLAHVRPGDGNFDIYLEAGGPIVIVDGALDFWGYVRASNYFNFAVGGVEYLRVGATGALVDDIVELTAAHGVEIEGVRAQDSFLEVAEIATPGNPAADKARLYAHDVGGVTKPMWLDSAGTETDLTAAGGGGGTKIVDADADTKVDVEEGADDDTVRIDLGGGAPVADAIVMTAAGGLISKISVIPNTDSAIDLGDATPKYWRAVYVDKVYLNSTATLDGATAGQVTLTGTVRTSGAVGIESAPGAIASITISPTAKTGTYLGMDMSPITTFSGDTQVATGIGGSATGKCTVAHVGEEVYGLSFYATAWSVAVNATYAAVEAVQAWCNILSQTSGALTVTIAKALHARFPAIAHYGTSTLAITTYCGLDVDNPASNHIATAYGVRITGPTLATTANFGIYETGATGAAGTVTNVLQSFTCIGAAAAPALSAVLELQTTTGALLVSRLTTAQLAALTAVNGMIAYESTLNLFKAYENGAWRTL